jgi:DNA-binding response OmpR family regulator
LEHRSIVAFRDDPVSNLSTLTSVSDHPHRAGGQPIVLVVEDDIMVRQAVTMLLEDEGFNIVTAIDGVDGLQKFHKIKPNVVLTDIIMPEKEGIALITELRRESPDVKIIAMSGGGRVGKMDFVSIAIALGANVGLHKPFDDLQLIETIRGLLQPASAVPMRASAA